MGNIIISPIFKHYAALGFIKYRNFLETTLEDIKDDLFAFVGDVSNKLKDITMYHEKVYHKSEGGDFLELSTDETVNHLNDIKKNIIFIKKIPASAFYLCIAKAPWDENYPRERITIGDDVYQTNFFSSEGQEDAEDPKYSYYTSESLDSSGSKIVKIWKCTKQGDGIATQKPHENEDKMYDDDKNPINYTFSDGYEWINEYTFKIDADWNWDCEDYYPLYKTFSESEINNLPHFIKLISNVIVAKVDFVGDEKVSTLAKLPYAIPFYSIGIVKNVNIKSNAANINSFKCTYTLTLNNCAGEFKTVIDEGNANTNSTDFMERVKAIEFETLKVIGINKDKTLGTAKILSDVTLTSNDDNNKRVRKILLCYDINGKFENYVSDVRDGFEVTDTIEHNISNRRMSVEGSMSYASGDIYSIEEPEATFDNAKFVYFCNMSDPVYRYKNESQTFYIGIEL